MAEAAVVAAPDDRLGERVAAFVQLCEGDQVTLDDVQSLFEHAGVARQKTPEQIYLVTEFPRTASGKVQKAVLRQQLRIDVDRSGQRWTSR